MRVTYSRRALRQLEEIHAYIDERNPQAAREIIARVGALCEQLGAFPGIGTQTDQAGVRVLPVVRYPYNIFYMLIPGQDEVRILRIRHSARRPEPLSDDELKGN